MNERNEIKSAWEIALEKVRNIQMSEEELNRTGYVEEGKKIAARFIREGKPDLAFSMKKYPKDAKAHVQEGIEFVLFCNIVLPITDSLKKDALNAIEGLKVLYQGKRTFIGILSAVRELLESYRVDREENYRKLKKSFQMRMENTKRAVEDQLGLKVKIEARNHPEFIKEWRMLLTQLDGEYSRILEEYKEKLRRSLKEE